MKKQTKKQEQINTAKDKILKTIEKDESFKQNSRKQEVYALACRRVYEIYRAKQVKKQK